MYSGVPTNVPGDSCARLIVIEKGEVALSAAVDPSAPPAIPPGYRRPVAARREAFTLASFDRLRILTTELKRLFAAGAPVALRLESDRHSTSRDSRLRCGGCDAWLCLWQSPQVIQYRISGDSRKARLPGAERAMSKGICALDEGRPDSC
jgi:hypothetical protein